MIEGVCETTECINLVEENYDTLLNANKTLRQRFCSSCVIIRQQEHERKMWREDLGIG